MELHILFNGCNEYQIIFISDSDKAIKLYSDLYNTKLHCSDQSNNIDLMRIEAGTNYYRFLVPSAIMDCYLTNPNEDKND